MEESKLLNKYLQKPNSGKHKISWFITKILVCFIILFSSLIFTSSSDNNLLIFKKYVFDDTFNFMNFQNFYQKFSGQITQNKETKMAFGSLEYISVEKYLDGENFAIAKDTPIKALSSGIVVFAGEKEGFNKTLIIQGSNGYDIWYGNLDNINVNIYDYIADSSLIASASDNLYLVITKDSKFYTYEEYQNQI